MGNKITTREGFISDNLVNIGKRLQINHELQHGEEKPSEVPAAPVEKLSVRRVALDRTEVERMMRELRDRIGHEAAAVGAELEQMGIRREELERFRDFLSGAASELEHIDPSAADAARRVGEIRYRLFTASGRAQKFADPRGMGQGGVSDTGIEQKTLGMLWRESLPLVLALLGAALLVGAAIIYSLH